ncbi:MAG: N-6 DNA methylase [Bacteroidia bacterium]
MTPKEKAYSEIAALVERFEEQYHSYKKSDYNETQTRRDFIDPFFKALGWDVDNENGNAESYREVIHEDRVKIGKTTKAPDYSFRLAGGKRLFFVEAKKPSTAIKDDILPAFQVRRYGWSAKLAISIVTDFEEFAIYDCTKKPKPDDKAGVARINYLTFRDYIKEKEFDFIWDTFSKERVLKGSFDKFIEGSANKKGTTTVDKDFLQSLDNWRTYLATSISWNNKNLEEDEINFVVQQTIDRIIFLRIAEDRDIEPEDNLRHCIKQGNYYQNLFNVFKVADEKYNSGLFDFKKDKISKDLVIDNKVIKNIITELYFPSPYAFAVMPVEILGTAYEQFLGKQIKIDKAHRAHIEEKPEVRKAGGVYYTPQYVVEYIVKNTVGKLIENKAPNTITKIKIVDPACGSGSFLIGAYDYLLKHHLDYYISNPTAAKKDKALTATGALTTSLKKQILLNNIYGVDIDVNAVEVTKLSLLLKCMEGETQASIENQLRLFNERVLPTLDNNIKDGNSLVDTDFYDGQIDFGDEKKVKPFNWQRAFPEVFNISLSKIEPIKKLKRALKNVMEAEEQLDYTVRDYIDKVEEPKVPYGNIGFDIVIGNPPYVRQELLGLQKLYFQNKYRVFHGMADLYSYFIEKSIQLLKPDGIYGVIVANKWMRANYGEPLRKYLKQQTIHEIIDFGDLPVFETATTYPCILIAGKADKINKIFKLTIAKTLGFSSLEKYVEQEYDYAKKDSLDDSGWNLANETEQKLLKKLEEAGIPLGEYVKKKIYYGIKTGLNEAFVIDEPTKERLIKEDIRSVDVIKPFLGGRDIKRNQPLPSYKYLIFFPKGFTNEKGNNPKNQWKWLHENYTAIANHLMLFEDAGKKRFDQGDYWWELRACDYYSEFEKPKIIIPAIVKSASYTYDTNCFYSNDKTSIVPTTDLYLFALMNSKCVDYIMPKISSSKQGGYFEYKPMYVSKLPIKVIDFKNAFEKKSHDEIVKLTQQLLQLNQEKSETKLQTKISQLEGKIDYCENRVNEIVYELYDLTEDEIKIVEAK